MARFKKHLLVALGFALSGAIGAAFGTGTAQAVVATLVEIVNPATSPALTRDVDNSARQPFSMNIPTHISNNSIGVSTSGANLAAGRRYVIESVSVYSLETKGTDAFWVASVSANSGGTFVSANFSVQNSLPGYNVGVQDIFATTQPVYLTPDANTSISVGIQRVGTTGDGNVTFTLTGYSVAQ